MHAVDLQNAVERPEIDNFNCLLFRLMLKADAGNIGKLMTVYPVQGRMVLLYRGHMTTNFTRATYQEIEEEARRLVKPDVAVKIPVQVLARFSVAVDQENEITIQDNNDGARTITNDAENVVAFLFQRGLIKNGKRLYYYDTDDTLSELQHHDGKFTGFAPGPQRRG